MAITKETALEKQIKDILFKEYQLYPGELEYKSILAAYALYIAPTVNTSYEFFTTPRFTNDDMPNIISRDITEEDWIKLSAILEEDYTDEDYFFITNTLIDKYSIDIDGSDILPDGLNELVWEFTNLQTGESLIDLFSGSGKYLNEWGSSYVNENMFHPENGEHREIYGLETNQHKWSIAVIKAELYSNDVNFINTLFSYPNKLTNQYDKVLAIRRLGTIYSTSCNEHRLALDFAKTIGLDNLTNATSDEWIHAFMALSLIKDNGRAFVLMPQGAMTNKQDSYIRKSLIENNLVAGVINLPERLFSNTAISSSLLILGKKEGSIKLIDATTLHGTDIKNNFIRSEDIDEIINACSEDTEYVISVSKDEFAKNDWSFNHRRYTSNITGFECSLKLEDILNNITRGVAISSTELTHITTSDETPYRFLMLSDITDNNFKSVTLPHLKCIKQSQEKYCLPKTGLVLAKNTPPYKVAIPEDIQKLKILVNSNLFILDIKTDLIDPLYLKMYLESPSGQKALDAITTGTSTKTLGIKELRNMMVPVPSLREQHKLTVAYKNSQMEIISLKEQLEAAKLNQSKLIEDFLSIN